MSTNSASVSSAGLTPPQLLEEAFLFVLCYYLVRNESLYYYTIPALSKQTFGSTLSLSFPHKIATRSRNALHSSSGQLASDWCGWCESDPPVTSSPCLC